MHPTAGSFALALMLVLALVLTTSPGCGPRDPAGLPVAADDPAPEPETDRPQDARPLTPGAPVEVRLTGTLPHHYDVALGAGDYLRLVVEQQGVDVVVVLSDPSGQELLEVDSPTSGWGPETIFAVAAMSGVHGVEVRAWNAKASGRYTVKVEELRTPSRRDRDRATAAAIFAEGERLRRQAGADSLRAAVERYEKALPLWRATGLPLQEAVTHHRLGQVHKRLSEVRDAVAHFEKALSLADALGRRDQEAGLFNDMGGAWRLLGETGKASAAYTEALRAARAQGDRREETATLNNLALLSMHLGETWKALLLYEQALQGWKDLGEQAGEAVTLHNIGTSYMLVDRLPEALDALNRSLELRRATGDLKGEAMTLSALGFAHFESGMTEAALADFRRTLELRRQVGDRRGEASTLERLGTTHLRSGRLAEALASYEQALAIVRDLDDRLTEAQILNSIGELWERRGEPDKALGYHHTALRIFLETHDRRGEAVARFRSAHAEHSRGDLLAACSEVKQALEIVESLRSDSGSQELRSSYLASVHDYYELYVELLMRLHELEPGRGHDVLAFETIERGRARSLLETMTGARRLADTDDRLAEREAVLSRAINAKERERVQLAAGTPRRDELAAVETDLRDLLLAHERVRTRIRAAGAGTAPVEPADMSEIRQLLDEDTLLLIYHLGEERSFLGLVSRSELVTRELPPRAEIETAALRLHDLLSRSRGRGTETQARLAAAALGEVLLAGVAERLATKRLVVVADGALHFVPFAALSLTPDGAPLVAEHEILSLPSASVLAVLRRELAERRPAPATLAMVADPVFNGGDPRLGAPSGTPHAALPELLGRGSSDSLAALERSADDLGLDGFDRLPFSRQEAEAILALAGEEETLKALGFTASRETVTGGELARYRMVHFATHGLLNGRHPELSGIVLSLLNDRGESRDGFLRAYEIYSLDLPADLVVLSACRSALGKSVRGEGLVGLTHAFMSAGAGRVVVSLWNVNDQGAAELMERLYRGILKDDLRPPAALRAAQLSMLAQRRWEAPYYWAGFILYGEWR